MFDLLSHVYLVCQGEAFKSVSNIKFEEPMQKY